jgi:sigma-B regulation protein RsbU (phosphoserine phosphatase)
VRSLLRLNEAVQKINSILDLDQLLDSVVNDIANAFGCLEAEVLLKEDGSNEVWVAAVMGCSHCVKRDRFTIGVDGLVGYTAAIGMTVYTPDVSKEPRYIACEESTRSELDIPLIAHGRVIGVFSAQHPEIDGFPAEQRALLEALAAHIAVAIENARILQRERAEKGLLRAQEEEARRIQQGLFPKESPQLPGFLVEGRCIPAGAVGGDWYDFMPLSARPGGERLWGLVLADVAGKGMAAALLMSATRGILRSVTKHTVSPAEVLEKLNRSLMEDLPPEKFVTMIYAVLDPANRRLTFANAGHPWPVFADGGEPHFLKTKCGLPLGIADCEFDECTVDLPESSRILLYSDGVTDAAAADGDEYGASRLHDLAMRKDLSAQQVLSDVRQFSGTRPQADDATVIVLKANP